MTAVAMNESRWKTLEILSSASLSCNQLSVAGTLLEAGSFYPIMTRIWITNGTPTIPGILNPLMAACDRGFVPDEVHILSNPGVADSVAKASEKLDVIIDAYGGDPDVEAYELEHETDFREIVNFHRATIETAEENGDPIAVDVTPGRKFMSAIGFQAGFRFGADHVFYFHRKAGSYYGQFYPEIPRTATDLIDFTEVL